MTTRTAKVAGATVTIETDSQAPSAQITRAASATVDVTDANGRTITLKKPTPLGNLDFAKAAGTTGMNQLYLAEVAHLKFVASIDGVPVATPTTEPELRALYSRLGEEGNEAAQTAVFEHFVPKSADAAEGLLKNS